MRRIPPAGAEQLGLAGEVEREPRRAPALGRRLEGLGKVVDVDRHLPHAVVAQQGELVGDERDAADGEGGLRQQLA